MCKRWISWIWWFHIISDLHFRLQILLTISAFRVIYSASHSRVPEMLYPEMWIMHISGYSISGNLPCAADHTSPGIYCLFLHLFALRTYRGFAFICDSSPTKIRMNFLQKVQSTSRSRYLLFWCAEIHHFFISILLMVCGSNAGDVAAPQPTLKRVRWSPAGPSTCLNQAGNGPILPGESQSESPIWGTGLCIRLGLKWAWKFPFYSSFSRQGIFIRLALDCILIRILFRIDSHLIHWGPFWFVSDAIDFFSFCARRSTATWHATDIQV